MNTFPSLTSLAVIVVFVLMTPQPAESLLVEVAQESAPGQGDFDSHVLGEIEAFEFAGTAADFYQYDVGCRTSYCGDDIDLEDHVSQLFVVDPAADDGIAVGIVHDARGGGGGSQSGTSNHVTFVVSSDPNSVQVLVRDDPSSEANSDDVYFADGIQLGDSPDDGVGSTTFEALQDWAFCCTDGFLIGPFQGDWTVLTEFTVDATGGNEWRAASADGQDLSLQLQEGRRVRLRLPEPSRPVLLISGLIMISAARWERLRRVKVTVHSTDHLV